MNKNYVKLCMHISGVTRQSDFYNAAPPLVNKMFYACTPPAHRIITKVTCNCKRKIYYIRQNHI